MSAVLVRSLTAGYPRRKVIADLSLEAPVARVTALIGPNGSGKSTLMRAIAGLLPATGDVELAGEQLLSLPLAARAKRVSFLPQNALADTSMLVIEAAIAALRVAESGAPSDHGDIRCDVFAALHRLGIADLAFEPLDALSGGQRQLAGLAQIVARRTPVILLDEPTSALDVRAQLEVMGEIRALADAGAAVVVVLHDLELAARWSDRLVVLDGGRVHSSGEATEVMTAEMLAQVYGVQGRIERCSLGKLNVIIDGPLPRRIDGRDERD